MPAPQVAHPHRHDRTQPRKHSLPEIHPVRGQRTLRPLRRLPTLTPATAPIGFRCQFERVVMNPPFNKGQDLKHIAHAVTHWLRPGGQLVAVMLPHTDEDDQQSLGRSRSTFAVGPPKTSRPAPSRSPAPTSAPACCCWRKARAPPNQVLPPIPPQIAFHASLSDLPLFAGT